MAIKDSILADGTDPHVVPTTIQYWLDPEKGGYKVFYPGTAGGYRRKHDPRPTQITDVSGHEEEFSLEKQGFTYIHHESKEKEFADDEATKERLYPEVIEMLKEL
jgi:hypothetical protein